MSDNRRAEQGVVDGPPKMQLGPRRVVASETRQHEAEQQAARILPWVGAHNEADVERLHGEHQSRMHLLRNFQLCGPEKHCARD